MVPNSPAPTVLIVEDDEVLLRMETKMLNALGFHHVLRATDYDEALELAERWDVKLALAVVDIVLPSGFGSDLALRIRASHPRVKFLLMSGDTANFERTVVHLGACCAGLKKPFTVQQFSEKVSQLLESAGRPDPTSGAGDN